MDIKNGIMETNEILTSLKKALAGLEIAEFEMNRPHEDVVSMSVCYGARQSLISLLQLYLEVEWGCELLKKRPVFVKSGVF